MKSFHLAAAAICLATTSSTMAIAQEKVQISYSGVVTIDHIDGAINDGNYFYGNGDISFRWSTVNDVKFGVNLGLETLGIFNDQVNYDFNAYYAAGVVEGRFGKISIGMPRGVMDHYFAVPTLGGSEIFDTDTILLGVDIFRYLKLFLSEKDMDMYGARYDGKFGQIEVAASLSKFSDSWGNVAELVARYDAGQWSVTLGSTIFDPEGTSGNVASVNGTSLEVQGRSGKLSGGMVYSKWDKLFLSESIRGFVSYDVNDVIKLNTQVVHYQIDDQGNVDSESNIYSVDLSYKHETGAFINAGVISSDSWDGNEFSLSLGYKF